GGVSSFGYSGTNSHVVIEEDRASEAEVGSIDDVRPQPLREGSGSLESSVVEQPVPVLTLSARSPEALRALAERYATWLREHPDADLADVCYTTNIGRSHFNHRFAGVVRTVEEALEQLASLAAGNVPPGH